MVVVVVVYGVIKGFTCNTPQDVPLSCKRHTCSARAHAANSSTKLFNFKIIVVALRALIKITNYFSTYVHIKL